jgi:hypothetical protein
MSDTNTRPHLWGCYNNGAWEWIDTADEHNSKDFLLSEYRMAFGVGWKFRWSNKNAYSQRGSEEE